MWIVPTVAVPMLELKGTLVAMEGRGGPCYAVTLPPGPSHDLVGRRVRINGEEQEVIGIELARKVGKSTHEREAIIVVRSRIAALKTIRVPVLRGFEQDKVIGMLEIYAHEVDPTNQHIAFGYTTNEDGKTLTLICASLTPDAQFGGAPCLDGSCSRFRTMAGGCAKCGDPSL